MDNMDEILISLLHLNISSEEKEYIRLYQNWNKVLNDKTLENHCRLEGLENRILKVSLDHSGWIQLFKMKEADILEILKNDYPSLGCRRIHTVLGRSQ